MYFDFHNFKFLIFENKRKFGFNFSLVVLIQVRRFTSVFTFYFYSLSFFLLLSVHFNQAWNVLRDRNGFWKFYYVTHLDSLNTILNISYEYILEHNY